MADVNDTEEITPPSEESPDDNVDTTPTTRPTAVLETVLYVLSNLKEVGQTGANRGTMRGSFSNDYTYQHFASSVTESTFNDFQKTPRPYSGQADLDPTLNNEAAITDHYEAVAEYIKAMPEYEGATTLIVEPYKKGDIVTGWYFRLGYEKTKKALERVRAELGHVETETLQIPIELPVSTRFMVLPDMEAIKQWYKDGKYKQEYEAYYTRHPNINNHANVLTDNEYFMHDEIEEETK